MKKPKPLLNKRDTKKLIMLVGDLTHGTFSFADLEVALGKLAGAPVEELMRSEIESWFVKYALEFMETI